VNWEKEKDILGTMLAQAELRGKMQLAETLMRINEVYGIDAMYDELDKWLLRRQVNEAK
jgi:hypothetical protein